MTLEGDRRRFVGAARVGRLATVGNSGQPHIVPVCFALVDERLVTPIDVKPKRVEAARLQRVRNVRAAGVASLLVDHYEEDWSALGWVRVDGPASIVESDAGAVTALREKYDQYHDHPLEDRPMIAIDVDHVTAWGSLAEPP